MPLLEENLWIEGGYYVDFDAASQFRIIGPNNHLYCGLIEVPKEKIKINSVHSPAPFELSVKGFFKDQEIDFFFPIMDDMRTIRALTKVDEKTPAGASFRELRKNNLNRSLARDARYVNHKNKKILRFRRHYGKYWYGVEVILSREIAVEEIIQPFHGFKLSVPQGQKIPFEIFAATNDHSAYHPFSRFFIYHPFDFKVFENLEKKCSGSEKKIEDFFKRADKEIEHLLTWSKTSGDSYGTIFPRDYMEAADLGVHDLVEEVRSYMYEVTLKNVNEAGKAWHEDVVGEYKFEYLASGKDIFDRKMIDIEPHILMGLKMLSKSFLAARKNQEKLQHVAMFLVERARQNELITFEPLPQEKKLLDRHYYRVGNWRDTGRAYKVPTDLIAPFDVNAVFYPEALKILKEHLTPLDLNVPDIDALITKWDKVKDRFRFKNQDGLSAFALALYGEEKKKGQIRWRQLAVNHLDEAYLYTYGSDVSEEDLVSFCKRLLEEKYFYTPAGPLLIERNNTFGYTSREYHGLVIWTKQVAFVILGLSKNLKRGIKEGWPKEKLVSLKKALLKTAEAVMSSFLILGSIPELHVWSEEKQKPLLFTAQEGILAGQMSKVQLWSAVGARRIFRKYREWQTLKKYRF